MRVASLESKILQPHCGRGSTRRRYPRPCSGPGFRVAWQGYQGCVCTSPPPLLHFRGTRILQLGGGNDQHHFLGGRYQHLFQGPDSDRPGCIYNVFLRISMIMMVTAAARRIFAEELKWGGGGRTNAIWGGGND